MADDRPVNRRSFFRQGLRELLRPLVQAVEPLHEAAQKLSDLDAPPPPPAPLMPEPASTPMSEGGFLRPPGAIAEHEFLNACTRSGQCVNACPAQAIRLDPNGLEAGGAPYINVDEMPCMACDGLYCMQVCPSGALEPTPLIALDLGTAIWRDWACLRSSGEECTICIDRCPIGSAAIELIESQVTVKARSCIGCGVCQHDCPTIPKGILVIPKAVRNFEKPVE